VRTGLTLAHGKNFRIYDEIFEEGAIHLELQHCEFESTHEGITLRIPLDVVLVMQKLELVKLYWIGKTDQEIRAWVEGAVEVRLHDFATHASDQNRGLLATSSSLGCIDDSREVQVATGIQYYTALREEQEAILERNKQHSIVSSHERKRPT
jgi:hypothetical protein